MTLRVQWLPEIRSLEIKISAFKNNSPIPFISDVGDRESPWEVKVLASPTDKFRLRATQLQGGRLAVIIIDASGGFSQNQRLEPGTIEVTN